MDVIKPVEPLPKNHSSSFFEGATLCNRAAARVLDALVWTAHNLGQLFEQFSETDKTMVAIDPSELSPRAAHLIGALEKKGYRAKIMNNIVSLSNVQGTGRTTNLWSDSIQLELVFRNWGLTKPSMIYFDQARDLDYPKQDTIFWYQPFTAHAATEGAVYAVPLWNASSYERFFDVMLSKMSDKPSLRNGPPSCAQHRAELLAQRSAGVFRGLNNIFHNKT